MSDAQQTQDIHSSSFDGYNDNVFARRSESIVSDDSSGNLRESGKGKSANRDPRKSSTSSFKAKKKKAGGAAPKTLANASVLNAQQQKEKALIQKSVKGSSLEKDGKEQLGPNEDEGNNAALEQRE